MKKFLFLIIIPIVILSCKSDKKEQDATVYYLIRHAEKDRNIKDKNPELTEVGLKRAENWAKVFKDIPFDKIYSTDYKRTQQTAFPTASSKGLDVLSYDAENLFNIFRLANKNKFLVSVSQDSCRPHGCLQKHNHYRFFLDNFIISFLLSGL